MKPTDTLTVLTLETPRGHVFIFREDEFREARELAKSYPGARIIANEFRVVDAQREDITEA